MFQPTVVLPLLIATLTTTLLTTPVRAQGGEPLNRQTFLPNIEATLDAPVEPPAPSQPSPYNVQARDLTLVPEDMLVDEFDQNGEAPLELTDLWRSIGVANGYATAMVSDEEFFSVEPLAINSYVLVFYTPEQAASFFAAQIQEWEKDPELIKSFNEVQKQSFIDYETIQGYEMLYTLAIGYRGNVVTWTYDLALASRSGPLFEYVDIILGKLSSTQSSMAPAEQPQAQNAHTDESLWTLERRLETLTPPQLLHR